MKEEEKAEIAKSLINDLIDLGFKYKEFGVDVSPSIAFYCKDKKKYEIISCYVSCKASDYFKHEQISDYLVTSRKRFLAKVEAACEEAKSKKAISNKVKAAKLRAELRALEEEC